MARSAHLSWQGHPTDAASSGLLHVATSHQDLPGAAPAERTTAPPIALFGIGAWPMPAAPQASAMFVVIWEYETHTDATEAFESMYGSDGAWVALFRQAQGYLGTELLRDRRPRHYLSLDRWATEADYDAFLAATGARYAELDAVGEALTLAERCIGRYQAPC